MIDDLPRREVGGALGRFTRDLTADARASRLEPVRQRDGEIARVIDILLRHGKNNPTLVGPAGVGKTAIADGLAQRIAIGAVPVALREVRLLSLDHVALLAGTTYRGQYEERIRVLVSETTAAGDIILFIDELHNLIGQGTAMGAAMDAANMLKPSLVRGDFRVIGATTSMEYDRWIGGDPALERRFQKIVVHELGAEATLEILLARKERLERHHNVLISDEALRAAITLTDHHVTDRMRPDKAIDALDEACAHLQAEAVYSDEAEALIRERIRAARARAGRHGGDARRTGREDAPAADSAEDDQRFERFAQSGMSALERFGAEIEAMLAPAGQAPPSPAPAPAAVDPAPAATRPPPPRGLAVIESDLAARLMQEGIVVRGHDVARVVGLMANAAVTWTPPPES